MAGFFLVGLLLGMPGTLVVSWHYHIDLAPSLVGLHFLALGVGFVLASQFLPRLYPKLSLHSTGLAASGLAFASLLALSFLPPPFVAAWRICLLGAVGLSAGALTCALIYVNRSSFESAPASSANRAGALFVGGAFLATVMAATTYFGGSSGTQTSLLSMFALAYALVLSRDRFPAAKQQLGFVREDRSPDDLKDFRRIATLLFSLLIFCQFACEWAIAGWLPLFLIHTLGINPVMSVWALGCYFMALIVGRLIAQFLMPIVSHRRILLFGVALAMAGYLFLSLTALAGGKLNTLALVAAIVIGLGHAPIYPLVAERMDSRLSFHPGQYSRAISIAVAAAMATPWLLGYIAEWFGMPAVMFVPAVGSMAVLLLVLLIMFEARLMGSKQIDAEDGLMASEQ